MAGICDSRAAEAMGGCLALITTAATAKLNHDVMGWMYCSPLAEKGVRLVSIAIATNVMASNTMQLHAAK